MRSKKIYAKGDAIHQPSQSNHDSCYLPACVRSHAGKPLYILIALWCLKQNDWVCRRKISEAFHITGRRAGYLMIYLRDKASGVVCESRLLTFDNVSRSEIIIHEVKTESGNRTFRKKAVKSTCAIRQKVGNADTSLANALWNKLDRDRLKDNEDSNE